MRIKKKRLATLIATCGMAGVTAQASAQQDPTAAGGGKKPFVMIVIDSSASMEWTTEGDDKYPWFDREFQPNNPAYAATPDVISPGDYDNYVIRSDVEMGIDEVNPNNGPMAFGPCVVWEPIDAEDSDDVDDECNDYYRPSWRPRVPSGWPLANPYQSWQPFPADGSGSLMGPRMWDFLRGSYDAANETIVSGGRLQDMAQPRHVTIKEAMTGQMILLPKNINTSNGIDFTNFDPREFGPGCWIVPRQRDATAVPPNDASYCLDNSGNEQGRFWHFPDHNQPIPHFQEVYDGQLRDGVMDRLSSTVIFAFAAFDGYRDDADDTDTDGDGDIDLKRWDPNKLNDSIDGSSPASLGGWRDDAGAPLQEGQSNCNGTGRPCYDLGVYRVVGPKRLDIPATFFPQVSAFTQIALNDTGYLTRSSNDDFTLSPKEGESRDRAFLGSTFTKDFDKYVDAYRLGRQPIARATPLAAVMHDVYQYFAGGQDGKNPIVDDEFKECRPKHVVLLSDGSPEPERGEATLEGQAFGYDKNRYIYGTTELEVEGMIRDDEGLLYPSSGDPVAENDFGVRVHAVGLNIAAGDAGAVGKLVGIAIEGKSCAQAVLGEEYIPIAAGGKCASDSLCLVDQSNQVSTYMGGGSYTWVAPGTTDPVDCSVAPAFILNSNNPDDISTVLHRMFSELLSQSGLSSRTRAVVANRLDQVATNGAGNDFTVGGQYRLYSGVKVGGSDWWKGVINRLTLPCVGAPPPQISLDEEVGKQVNLTNTRQDSRRVWTIIPDGRIYDHFFGGPQDMTLSTYAAPNSTFPMRFDLAKGSESKDEFQGTYIANSAAAEQAILGTRIPFRTQELKEGYLAADPTANYLATLNALNASDVDHFINAFRGRIAQRVPQSAGGAGGDARTISGILNSNPVVVGPPELDLPIGSYRDFRARFADRLTTLYVSSMDGMLHALYTGEGDVAKREMVTEGNMPGALDVATTVAASDQREAWAYLPFMMQRELASNTNSQPYLTDGTPVVKDVRLCDQNPNKNTNIQACRALCNGNGCSSFPSSHQWRTVLVQGRGLAGQGYFALDVTRPGGRDFSDTGVAQMENPDPIALWEFDPSWERAQVKYLMQNSPQRVSAGVNPPSSMWDVNECNKDVGTFWNSSFMGLSTSEPEIATLLVDYPGQGKAQRPVAVFGGGVTVADGTKCGDSATGMAIYVVDLQTGSLLRRFVSYYDDANVERHFADAPPAGDPFYDPPGAGHFAGAPALFDSSSGAIATRGFIGDSRGRLFRLDFLSSDPTDWKVEMFFDPYSDPKLRQSYTDAGFQSDEAFGPASFKPTIALTPKREVMVVYGTGEPGDAIANDQGQVIIALTENLSQGKGVLAWAEILGDGEKLTGEPIIFDRNVYFPTYAIPRDDVCDPGTARIWGLKLLDQDPNSIASAGSFGGNPDLAGPPTGVLVDTANGADPKWFGPEDPTIIRGVTVTLGPQCAVTNGGTDDPTIAAQSDQRPQLIAQTSGNIDADLKNKDDVSNSPPSNNIDRLVLNIPVPRTQSIPLSWSIVTN